MSISGVMGSCPCGPAAWVTTLPRSRASFSKTDVRVMEEMGVRLASSVVERSGWLAMSSGGEAIYILSPEMAEEQKV